MANRRWFIIVAAAVILWSAAARADVQAGAATPTLPWTTWEELARDVVFVDETRCGALSVGAVLARRAGVGYVFWLAPATGGVVAAVFPNGEFPRFIGTGRLDPKHPTRIPALAWTAYDPVRHAGGPCAFLDPRTA